MYQALFRSKHKKFQDFFASSEKKGHLSARVMAHTVQLLRHDAYCPKTVLLRLKSGQLIANQI